jgi:alpha-amylase
MEYFLKRLCLYVLGTVVNDWWDNGNQMIAFCRGGKGFIAFNGQYNTDFNVNLQVDLTMKLKFDP